MLCWRWIRTMPFAPLSLPEMIKPLQRNICRSPLAEGVMNYRAQLEGLDGKVQVDSCGTSDYHLGEKPDIRTRRNAEANGVKLSHLGRQLTPRDLEEFDFILVMDRSNHRSVMGLKNATQHASKIKLLRTK